MSGIGSAVAVLGMGSSYLAADKSAKAMEDAAKISADTSKYIYDKSIQLNDPFYQQGLSALPYLQAYTGVDMTVPSTPDRLATTADRRYGTGTTSTSPLSTVAPTAMPPIREGSIATSTGWVTPESGLPRPAESGTSVRYIPESGAPTQPTQPYRPTTTVPPVNLPSYQDIVLNPMESWNYEQSPAYQAKYTLGMQELNKQLQARGLAPSAIGGNRATDLSRRLTADDYNAERAYALGNRQDLYKSKYSENADRYNRLLDQVKMATGASSSMGQAGNQYANSVGQSAMQAGQARAGFYSGLPGAAMNGVSTGLKAYDYGNQQGWWGNGAAVTNAGLNAASTAYSPTMQPDQYANGLYGL